MSVPTVRIGNIASWAIRKGGKPVGREATVDIQSAEFWEAGDEGFSTLDVAPTRNKWNESKWFDVLTVLIIAVLSVALCFKLGLI